MADSSRYFVIKVTQGGKTAHLGLGFSDSADSFGINTTLHHQDSHSGANFNHGQEADDTGAVQDILHRTHSTGHTPQDTLHRTHSTGNTPHCISLHLSTLMIALNQENTAMHHFRGRENTAKSRKYYLSVDLQHSTTLR